MNIIQLRRSRLVRLTIALLLFIGIVYLVSGKSTTRSAVPAGEETEKQVYSQLLKDKNSSENVNFILVIQKQCFFILGLSRLRSKRRSTLSSRQIRWETLSLLRRSHGAVLERAVSLTFCVLIRRMRPPNLCQNLESTWSFQTRSVSLGL